MVIVGVDQAASAPRVLGRSALQHAVGCGIRCGIEEFFVFGPREPHAPILPGVHYVDDRSFLSLLAGAANDVVISRAEIVYEWDLLLQVLSSPSDICVAIGAMTRDASPADDENAVTAATIGLSVNIAGVYGHSIGLLKLSPRCARMAREANVVGLRDLLSFALENCLTVALSILARGWVNVRSPAAYEVISAAEQNDSTSMLRPSLLAGSPVISAGGIARRRGVNCDEVLLVGDGSPGTWRIPKGMIDQNESIEAAALREVREETGYDTRIDGHIGTAHWSYEYQGIPQEELAHFYSLATVSKLASRDAEHSAVEWLPITEAETALQYESERAILRRLRAKQGHQEFEDAQIPSSSPSAMDTSVYETDS